MLQQRNKHAAWTVSPGCHDEDAIDLRSVSGMGHGFVFSGRANGRNDSSKFIKLAWKFQGDECACRYLMNKIVAPVKPLQVHRFAKQNENPKHLDYHRVPKSRVSPYCKYAEHVAFGRYKPGTFLPHLDLTISWPAHCHWSQEGCEPVILEVAWVARHQCPKQKVWLDKCQYIPWGLMWQSYTWKIGKSSITIEFPGISSLVGSKSHMVHCMAHVGDKGKSHLLRNNIPITSSAICREYRSTGLPLEMIMRKGPNQLNLTWKQLKMDLSDRWNHPNYIAGFSEHRVFQKSTGQSQSYPLEWPCGRASFWDTPSFFFSGISHSYPVSAVSQASTHLRPPPWLHSGQCSQRHGGDGIPGESQPVEVSAKATFEMGKAKGLGSISLLPLKIRTLEVCPQQTQQKINVVVTAIEIMYSLQHPNVQSKRAFLASSHMPSSPLMPERPRHWWTFCDRGAFRLVCLENEALMWKNPMANIQFLAKGSLRPAHSWSSSWQVVCIRSSWDTPAHQRPRPSLQKTEPGERLFVAI